MLAARRTSRRIARRSLSAALAASIIACAGCAWRTKSSSTRDIALAESDSLISPVVMGGDNGLELRWWIISDDTGDDLAAALGAYTHLTVPVDPSVQDRWRENGLRLIKAPVDDLGSIRSALPVVGRVDRQWLGQSPRWIELLQGEAIPANARVLKDGHPSGLTQGRMRLLGRAWTSPSPQGPMIRADLALQHVPSNDLRLNAIDPMAVTRRIAAEARGSVLTELTANAQLEPGYAYLIVPEDPSRTWLAGGSMAAAPLFDWGEIAGPPAPPMPTIGQALLTGAPLQAGRADLRAVVILVPRVPTEFTLLAGAPTAASF